MERDLARADVERRPPVAAARAAVVPEVTHVRGREHVRGAAADAVLRVRRVLELRLGVARVVEPEDDRARPLAGEIADLRVVAVHDERRLRRQGVDRLPPALGDELELAVPIELVAEEVAQADRAGSKSHRNLRQGALVDLEQAELGAPRRREQGRGDTRDEVRARAVVHEPGAGPEDRRAQRGGGRLPVRGRDERRAER